MHDESRISVGWGDADRRFIVWVFRDRWQDDDMLDAIERGRAFRQQCPYRYALVDYRLNYVPLNFIPLIRFALANWHHGVRRVIVIADGNRWKKLYPLLGSIMEVFARHIHYVDTVDEGYAAIADLLEADEDPCPAREAISNPPPAEFL